MRYLIVSDTHQVHLNLLEVLEKNYPLDGVIHLGDAEGYEDQIENWAGDCVFYAVRGNNDTHLHLPLEQEIMIGGKKVWMTHGHRYHVYAGIEKLKKRAMELGVDVVLFGHTHEPFFQVSDNITFFNPGSISRPRQHKRVPTYGLLEIDEQGDWHWHLGEIKKK